MTRIRCCLYNSNTKKKKKILIGSTKIFSITQLKNQKFFFLTSMHVLLYILKIKVSYFIVYN